MFRLKNFILQNFPFLEDDFDAVDDYALFCKICGYMIEELKKQNGTLSSFNTKLIEFENQLNEYKEYFDNLDVQEEINNKLDEMAESGQLEQIIAQYIELNTIKTFNNVNDLHNAENLNNGSIAETMGFYTVGDGGSSKYLIRTITSSDVIDGYKIISLTNYPTLIAEIIIPEILNVHQFGIFGDGLTDVTEKMQKAFNYNLYIPSGLYLISDRISINNHLVYGDGIGLTEIKLKDNSSFENTAVIRSDGVNGFIIKNLSLNGNKETNQNPKYFLNLFNSYDVLIENVEFKNTYGSCTRLNGSNNVKIKNCSFKNTTGVSGNTAPAIYTNGIKNLLIDSCYCENIGDHFAYICSDSLTLTSEDITISNCILNTCGVDGLTNGSAIALYSNTKNVLINNCKIDSSRTGIQISNHGGIDIAPKDITISNCIINNSTLDSIYTFNSTSHRVNNILINNCIIKNSGQDAIDLRGADNVNVSNCYFIDNNRYGVESRNNNHIRFDNCVARNNTTAGFAFGYTNQYSNNITINNCETYCDDSERTQNTGMYLAHCQNVIVNNCNNHDNTTTNFSRNSDTTNVTIIGTVDPTSTNNSINSITFGNQIPNNAPHKVGDIIFYNIAPGSGYVGAVCTVAGTPGTWKQFGSN